MTEPTIPIRCLDGPCRDYIHDVPATCVVTGWQIALPVAYWNAGVAMGHDLGEYAQYIIDAKRRTARFKKYKKADIGKHTDRTMLS